MKRPVPVLHMVLATLTILAVSCEAAGPAAAPGPTGVAPTVNPIFLPAGTLAAAAGQPAPAAATGGVVLPAAQSTRLAEPTAAGVTLQVGSTVQAGAQLKAEGTAFATSRPRPQVHELPIYDDALNPDWSTEHSEGMNFSLTDSSHVHNGTVGAAITPELDLGRFFFTVRKGAQESYGLDRVLGVSLWINSGSEELDASNLGVTVVGSNDFPYWVADDNSVKIDDTHFFSETRLYYLGINRPVPPNTWVEIVVWLDKLPYEPDYKYVTGIYIKNDKGFRRTYYLDQVRLLVTN